MLGPDDGMAARTSKGDFTKGAGLNADDIAHVVVGVTDKAATIATDAIAAADVDLARVETGQGRRSELDEISKLVAASGYGPDRIVIDPSVVRGLEYYTGPVYEVELTARHQGRKGPARALRLGRRRRAL